MPFVMLNYLRANRGNCSCLDRYNLKLYRVQFGCWVPHSPHQSVSHSYNLLRFAWYPRVCSVPLRGQPRGEIKLESTKYITSDPQSKGETPSVPQKGRPEITPSIEGNSYTHKQLSTTSGSKGHLLEESRYFGIIKQPIPPYTISPAIRLLPDRQHHGDFSEYISPCCSCPA